MLKSVKINLVAYGLLSILLIAQTRTIRNSQIGDVQIKVTDDTWKCDKIECPLNTYRCYVAKEKDTRNSTILQRINICYSKDNQVLLQKSINETVAIDRKIKLQINSYRSGVISSVNSFSSDGGHFIVKPNNFHKKWNTDLKKIDHKQMWDIKSNLNYQMANMNKDFFEMNENLRNMSMKLNGDLSKININLNEMNEDLSKNLNVNNDKKDESKINLDNLNLNEMPTKMNGQLNEMTGIFVEMNDNFGEMNGNLSEMSDKLRETY